MINDFISNIRLDQSKKQLDDKGQQNQGVTDRGRAAAANALPGSSTMNDEEKLKRERLKEARREADLAILEAEKFKASVQNPSGRTNINQNYAFGIQHCNPLPNRIDMEQLKMARILDSDDDDFFHITCHVDPQLIIKIEQGQFVELSKLLHKHGIQEKEEGRMNIMNKNGLSYLVPSSDNDTKITGIRRWEQAFRIYAAIYCKANPHRAVEILQYVDVINKAAATFSWENVAKYDFTFRHLMASKPLRSWAKTYTQGWNLQLNDPVRKFSNDQYKSRNNGNGSGRRGDWRDNCCWRFNKSTCKYGRTCRYDHKCTYCGSQGHPVSECTRKNNNHSTKKKDQDNRRGSRSSSSTEHKEH